jgi:hypothetical protein
VQILFNNDSRIEISLFDTEPANTIRRMYHHLQHVELSFREKDDPFYTYKFTYTEVVNRLVHYGKIVSVEVDPARCLQHDQQYFNKLHKIYEKKYNGVTDWLNFHEHIHLCEQYITKPLMSLILDHREKAGPLNKKFQLEWLKESSTQICTGDVYLGWAELGKFPYQYWRDNEPNDLARMCELVKPWNTLRSTIHVGLENINILTNLKIDEFNSWWSIYENAWCDYWKIPSWPLEYQLGIIPVGKVSKVSEIKNMLQNNIYPTKVLLS